MASPLSERLDRRNAIKWMATVAAGTTLLPRALGQTTTSPSNDGATIAAAYDGPGYGTDPELNKSYAPGELWPLSFSDHQRVTAALLCGLIIPAHADGPSAADLKVHDFIDEWVSSPYPGQRGDRALILGGLAQLDADCTARHGGNFVELSAEQHEAVCERLAKIDASAPAAEQQLQRFFRRFRQLTADGHYTTPEGMRAAGYLGNVALAAYPQPPAELLQRLGLA